MTNLLNFKDKKTEIIDKRSHSMSSLISTAIRLGLQTPGLSVDSVVGLVAERLGKLISISNIRHRDRLLKLAIKILERTAKGEKLND